MISGLGQSTTLDHFSAGNTTTYAYNDLQELVKVTDPMGNVTSFGYDAQGNETSETDPDGNTTTITPNADNQTAETSYSGGTSTPSVTNTYKYGNLSEVEAGSATTYYSYDADNELCWSASSAGTDQECASPPSSGAITYSYDPNGNVTNIAVPGSDYSVTQTWNDQNELASVTDWDGHETAFCYDGAGNLVHIDYDVTGGECSDPSDVITQADTYNAANELTNIWDHEASTTIENFSYGRTPDGLVSSETDTDTPDAGSIDYGYNPLSELTSAGSSDYSYNDANDLTTSPSGQTQTFNADDEVTAQASTDYAYSSVGNRTSATPLTGTATTYGWNESHQLTSVLTGTATTDYTYDASGILASESGGTSASYVWSELGSGLSTMLSDGTNYYLYGPGSTPFEQINISSGAVKFLLTDDLGSVRGVVDTSGTLDGATTYDAWGNVKATSGTTGLTPFSYAGGYLDPSSGLLYFRARWYDAKSGQWMSLDPMVMDTESPYAYVNNDPVNGVDPTGDISDFVTLGCGPRIGATEDGVWDIVFDWDCDEGLLTWRFTLSRILQGYANNGITESGLVWYLNSSRHRLASPHVRSEFSVHGTIAPVKNGDHITWEDSLGWSGEDEKATYKGTGTLSGVIHLVRGHSNSDGFTLATRPLKVEGA